LVEAHDPSYQTKEVVVNEPIQYCIEPNHAQVPIVERQRKFSTIAIILSIFIVIAIAVAGFMLTKHFMPKFIRVRSEQVIPTNAQPTIDAIQQESLSTESDIKNTELIIAELQDSIAIITKQRDSLSNKILSLQERIENIQQAEISNRP
jgi:septal ring factor EnvC (AmiA/AmiB activator)